MVDDLDIVILKEFVGLLWSQIVVVAWDVSYEFEVSDRWLVVSDCE